MLRAAFVFLVLAFPVDAQEPSVEAPAEDGAAADEHVIRVGVRSFARPFSYSTGSSPLSLTPKSGPLRDKGYDGYMVYICDEVLKQMLIPENDTPGLSADQIRHVDVDEVMSKSPGEDRLRLLGEEIDILCDPATIDRERVRQYAVSAPVFVTGVGFLQLRDGELWYGCDPDRALIGAVGTTNAIRTGVQAILDGDEWKNYRTDVVSALRSDDGGTRDCPSDPDGDVSGIIWRGSTHVEVASRFCEGDVTFYVGDLEIIAAHASEIAGCDFSATPQSFTNDRYGIFAAIDYSKEWKALRIGRFFEVLNREITTSDSLLDRAYFAEFGRATQSPKLQMFYWSIRGTP